MSEVEVLDSALEERTLSIEDWNKEVNEDCVIVDIREEEQTKFGMIPGARNLPATNLSDFYSLPPDEQIYLYCQKGEMSSEVLEVLLDAGYDAYQLRGGYLAYLADLGKE